MRTIYSINFQDDGTIGVEWVESTEMTPRGGQYQTTHVTLSGQEADPQVEYYAKELRQDADEFLHAALKMLRDSRP